MLESERLILRQWVDSDLRPFAKLNQDEQVMRYFPATYSEARSRDFVGRCRAAIETHGWGFWAVEEKARRCFIGMVGLNRVPKDLPLEYEMEVGWRLAAKFWGCGYATEAARVSLNYAFDVLRSQQIVAFTPLTNVRSQRVMQKLNMKKLPATFEHPRVPAETGLAEHVVYIAKPSRSAGE